MATTLCYNRGCGKQYIPRENPDGCCQFHPGAPFFHEGYKGWTCCNKKTTDFTEFLNTPGCNKGQHSNVKPEEPEHITGQVGEANNIELPQVSDNVPDRESFESRIHLERPDFDKTQLTRLKPTVAASLVQQSKNLVQSEAVVSGQVCADEIPIGEPCKNGGCKATYQGENSNTHQCQYHPGVPIFHEGMKFWSCCQRKTTDFQSFLNQAGCSFGKCKWKKENDGGSEQVECRHDWHQTATHVTVAIYGKKYDPDSSYIEVNPIRMKCHIVFPEQGGSFDMDIELRGIINVEETKVNFLGTKVEIKMRKAEPGAWAKLDIPREIKKFEEKKVETPKTPKIVDDDIDDLDLDDLNLLPTKMELSQEARTRIHSVEELE